MASAEERECDECGKVVAPDAYCSFHQLCEGCDPRCDPYETMEVE